ncbi:hypothetical protein Q7P35_003633 [Cladosporium inversicolor]
MASRRINNLTVAGITGAIGPSIIHLLDAAGFRVQALTRHRQMTYIPSKFKIVEVDYNDGGALRKVLRDQDAVVSCLGDVPAAVRAQDSLLNASLAVGVKRFVPSEFGSDTTNRRVMSYPFFRAKVKHQRRLRQAARTYRDFSYSLLITGPFLDWGLSKVPFIINVGTSTAEVIDGGNVPFSTTRTPTVGNAVAAIFTRSHETKNRALFIHEGITTQNKLIAHAQTLLSLTGDISKPARAFNVTNFNGAAAEQAAWKAFRRPATDPTEWALPFINLSLWSGRELCRFEHTDNELLGIRALRGAEFDAVPSGKEKASNAFGLVSRCSRVQVMEAESRGHRALETGKEILGGRYANRHAEQEAITGMSPVNG